MVGMEARLKLLKQFVIGEMIMDLSYNTFSQDFRNKWPIRIRMVIIKTRWIMYNLNKVQWCTF